MSPGHINQQTGPLGGIEWLKEQINRQYGIHISSKQESQLRTEINSRRHALGLEDCEQYLEYIRTHEEELSRLIQRLTVNKTYFFREPEQWNYLLTLLSRQKLPSKHKIHCWSAACSSGEEPYSAAMCMDYVLNQQNQHNPSTFHVLGTDVSKHVLETAQQGQYDRDQMEALRSYRPEFYDLYVHNNEGMGKYSMTSSIRHSTHYRLFNLRSDHYPYRNKFDVIFCRNVLIYFSPQTIEYVVQQLSKALKPTGVLFIGYTEHLRNITHPLEKVRSSVYRLNKQ